MLNKIFCSKCKKRETCTSLCSFVKKYVKGVEFWDANIVFTEAGNLDYINNGECSDLSNNFLLGEDEKAFILHMNRLTKRQRECFLMYYFDSKTQCEIADILNINQRTVSYHLLRAKEKIVKTLSNKVDYISVDDVDDLEDSEKIVLKLYYIEGLTQREIADISNISQPAIHKKLARASQKFNNLRSLGYE